MAKILKGWTLNGIFRFDSGRPLVITMNNDLAGLLFNGVKRPNRNDGTAGVSDLSNFDPAKNSYFNKAAWTDPGPLQFGNAPARDGGVRGFSNIVEDVSIFKVTTFHERYKLRFEAQGASDVRADVVARFAVGAALYRARRAQPLLGGERPRHRARV